jgi:hypothetical protein
MQGLSLCESWKPCVASWRNSCLTNNRSRFTHIPTRQKRERTGGPSQVFETFFDNVPVVRETVLEMRKDVTADPEVEWSPIHIEKIETLPVSKDTLLAFLNDGVGAFIKRYEIVETIE